MCLPLPGVSRAVWQGKAQFDALSSADPSAVRNAAQRKAKLRCATQSIAAHDSFALFGGHQVMLANTSVGGGTALAVQVWVLQSWQFYAMSVWTPEQIRAYLSQAGLRRGCQAQHCTAPSHPKQPHQLHASCCGGAVGAACCAVE